MRALKATKAKTICIVDGAWHNDGYTTARDDQQLISLLKQATDGWASFGYSVLSAPLVKYRIVTAKRGDAS